MFSSFLHSPSAKSPSPSLTLFPPPLTLCPHSPFSFPSHPVSSSIHSPKLRMSFISFDDIPDVATQLPLTSNRTLIDDGIERMKNMTKISSETHLEPAINEVMCYRAVFTVIMTYKKMQTLYTFASVLVIIQQCVIVHYNY